MQHGRFIVHVDMDAFFAAIEQRDNPELRGKPVVVGANPKGGAGRGVVSTCSYEARAFGIHSAMPISIAYRKCPRAVFLPVDIEKYSRVSDQIYTILCGITPQVEQTSIDEAFLDISGSYCTFGSPLETCREIKSRINSATALTASLGLAPIKMAAKIASDLSKPDGLVEVTSDGLFDFLWPLEIRKLLGLGEKSQRVLHSLGIMTIGDLARSDVHKMSAVLGKNGVYFWKLANGIDESEVETECEIRSISNEVTFDQDTRDPDKLKSTLMALCEKVSHRLRREGFKGRTITLKIRRDDFRTFTRSVTMSESTNFVDILYREIRHLYQKSGIRGKKVRLLGVKVSNLVPAGFQETLFAGEGDEQREKLHEAVDRVKEKFGDEAIHRGGTLMFDN